MNSAFWACAIITLLSALVSVSFSLAALRSSGAALVNAMYGSARSIALAVVCAVPLFTGLYPWLAAAALAMVIVQALDALIGVKRRNVVQTAGPAVMAVVNLVLLIWLVRA